MITSRIICDRRIYRFKGKWINPKDNQLPKNIFYYHEQPTTLVATFEKGREVLKETATIKVYGAYPIAKGDTITLEDGSEFKVINLTPDYFENNIIVGDLLKQRVSSITLYLQ